MLFSLFFFLPLSAHAQEPNPDGEPERLEAPPLPEHPTQLDYGAYEYAQRCMACHGDRGQGLTEEWRVAWGAEEMNCWQSKCHAANHPPEGFKLLEYAPPVIGKGSLLRFQSAQELYNFLEEQMPWQAPGSLEEETYWQLTAFLLERNQIALENDDLGPHNAGEIWLREKPAEELPVMPPDNPPPSYPAIHPLPWWVVSVWLGGMLLLGGVSGVVVVWKSE